MKKVSFRMSDELHSELKETATDAETSMASICREAVTEHLETLSQDDSGPPVPRVGESLSSPEAPTAPLKRSRPEPRGPWYVRYADKIDNYYTGQAPKSSRSNHHPSPGSEPMSWDEIWSR